MKLKSHLSICLGIILLLPALCVASADEKTASQEITIDNFKFKPEIVTVPVGTKITWINHDDVPHTVLSIDKTTIVSPGLDTDEKFSFTFKTAGTNDYYCSVHPHMKGRIIVR